MLSLIFHGRLLTIAATIVVLTPKNSTDRHSSAGSIHQSRADAPSVPKTKNAMLPAKVFSGFQGRALALKCVPISVAAPSPSGQHSP